ncbi:MAG: MG2 domain-containing protein [Lentisphaeria bacterium]
MTTSTEIESRIRGYLDAVRSNVADRAAPVRAELLRQLESHLREALRQRGGEAPSVTDVEAVLAEMDPPDAYCAEGDVAPAVPPPVRETACRPVGTGGGKWFVLALCFLALNGWAVWKWTADRAAAAPPVPAVPVAESVAPVAPKVEPLRLQTAAMAAYDAADQSVLLKLVFSEPPAAKQLGKFVTVSKDAQKREPLEWSLAGETTSKTILLKTAESVPSGEKLVITVAAGLPAVTALVPVTAQEQQLTVDIVNGFELGSAELRSPSFEPCVAELTFGKPVDVSTAAEFISVQPAVKWEVGQWYTGCTLTGEFAPGREYAVTFKKGLRAADGTLLGQTVTRQLRFPERTATLAIAADGAYLSPRGALNVPVAAMNVRACEVALRRVSGGNVVFCANGHNRYDEGLKRLGAPAVTRQLALPDTPNRENKFYVNLRELAGAAPAGVYHLAVSYKVAGSEWPRETGRLLVVTDLGISAKTAKDGVLVWVNSLRTAQPVADSEVVLYAQNNQELGRGRTDAQGLLFLPCQTADVPEELNPSLVTAAREGDQSYLAFADNRVGILDNGVGPYLDGACEAFLFSDRGVYRPGETLHVETLVRDATLAPPAPFPVLFQVEKPDGKLFREFPATLNVRGAAEFATELPAYLPTGRYTVRTVMPGTDQVLGTTEVAVEEFVPPQIAVTLAPLPARVTADRGFEVAVSARHLFGRPGAGLPVSASVRFHDAPFKPAAWDGYRFCDPERPAAEKDAELGEARLDADGQCRFTVAAAGRLRPAGALAASVCATVRDSGGRAVSATGETAVDVYPFYVGLKAAKAGGHVKVGEALTLAVVTVKPDGGVVQPEAPLLATVERVEWSSVMKRNGAAYVWQSERTKTKVGEPQKVMLREGRGEFPVTVDRAGQYIVTLADPFGGAAASLPVFAAAGDAEWVDWAKDRPAQVQLSLDRTSYLPGETARLAVKAPFAGAALLTVETDRVLERRLVTLTGNTAEVAIPVKPEYAPNAHCVLSLIRPAVAESVWSAHRAVGEVALTVTLPGHRLGVAVAAPATVRPQSRLEAVVTVTDEAGGKAAGVEVVVMAVDEGICQLTDLETPDPLAFFLRTRRLGVGLFDLYGALMPIAEDTADATVSHAGGDGGDDAPSRRLNPIKANRFKPVALWRAGVITDANGVARAAFEVPEFTGELRVTAVAFGARAFGAAQRPVTVKRPLVVQAGLPRFLAPGDRCRMSIDVFNETGAAQEAKWRVTCGGPLTAEPAEGALPLAVGGAGAIPVTLVAGALPGKGLCTVEVTAGTERYVEAIELAVRPVQGAATCVVGAALKPGEEAAVAAPAEWLAGTEFYEAWVSGVPDVKLAGGLDWLLRYPYGCCEQTTSAAFPLLVVADLAARLQPAALNGADSARLVMAGVYRLLTMQRESGGFAMWPDSRPVEPWASCYATHFLVEAKKAGHPVPADRLDEALDYLRTRLEKAPENRAYICQVLALAGRPEHGWMARLQDQAGELSAVDRAHLAAALLAAGQPRRAVPLLEGLGLPAPGVASAEARGSRTGDLALALSAWLDIAPDHPMVPRLVQELNVALEAGHGRWNTTQENALALLALGKFARLAKPDHTPFAGELLPVGAPAVPFTSGADLRWMSPAPGAVKSLRIVNRGPGTCWYGVRMEGVPAAGAAAAVDQGLTVRREFLDQDGGPCDPAKVRQGELVVVKLVLDTHGTALTDLVLEDLLPAGWEVENPALATAKTLPWAKANTAWCLHCELRDDRILLFTGAVSGRVEYYYTARAVTVGEFALPAVRVEAMYRPEIRSVNGAGKVEVVE